MILFFILWNFCFADFKDNQQEFPQFHFEESQQLPLVYLEFVFDHGVVYDPADQQGLTQLSAQLLLKGTKDKSNKAFQTALNQLGGSLEVAAKPEGVLLEGVVLSENLKPFLKLIEEVLVEPRLAKEDFESLKKEIQSTLLEKKSNDRANAQTHFDKAFFGTHPYGYSELGTAAGLKHITYADAKKRAQWIFNFNDMRLFGSGAADQKELGQWFQELKSKTKKEIQFPARFLPKPELSKGRRIFLIHKPNATQSQILLGGQSIRPENLGFYPVILANHSFGGGTFQSRMIQEIRVKRGWTYGAFNQFQNGRYARYFQMYVFPKTQDTIPAAQLMLSLLEQWAAKGITKEEFEFSQNSLIHNAPFQFDTAKKRLQNITMEYLKNYPMGFYQNFSQNIAQVPFEDVQKNLAQNINTKDLTLVILGDSNHLEKQLKQLHGFRVVSKRNYLEE